MHIQQVRIARVREANQLILELDHRGLHDGAPCGASILDEQQHEPTRSFEKALIQMRDEACPHSETC